MTKGNFVENNKQTKHMSKYFSAKKNAIIEGILTHKKYSFYIKQLN